MMCKYVHPFFVKKKEMKVIQYIMISTMLLILQQNVVAQTLSEAVQYSFYDYIGTARTAGVSNSFGSLGGDQGGIFLNPASLGTFRKGEFAISPTYFSSRTESNFNGSKKQDNPAIGITAANMGLVFASKGRASSKWKTSNIIIAFNKITDFERNQYFEGESEGTIVQRFAERANGLGLDELDPFEAGVAYDAEALFDEGSDLEYEFDAFEGQNTRKSQQISTDGGINELSLGWAGNYDNKLQFGFTVNFPFAKFTSTKTYREEAPEDQSAFRNLTYTEYLRTKGSGINLKVGIIAMPIKSVRIGLAIASPTGFDFEDSFSTSMLYNYVLGDGSPQSGSAESIDGTFNYAFTTPWRTTGSASYLLNTGDLKGFISAEVDYLNYTTSFFNLGSESENPADIELQNDLNEQIREQLTKGVNLRLGAELAYDIYRGRVGYQLSSSPYFGDEGTYFSGYSVGGGLRFDRFFFDIAYKTSGSSQGYLPYRSLNDANNPFVELQTQNSYISTTFGFKFGA